MRMKFSALVLPIQALLFSLTISGSASGQGVDQTAVRFLLTDRDVRPDAGTPPIHASLQNSVRACAVYCGRTPSCESYAVTSHDGATGSLMCYLYDVASKCVMSYLNSPGSFYYSRADARSCPPTTVSTTPFLSTTAATTFIVTNAPTPQPSEG